VEKAERQSSRLQDTVMVGGLPFKAVGGRAGETRIVGIEMETGAFIMTSAPRRAMGGPEASEMLKEYVRSRTGADELIRYAQEKIDRLCDSLGAPRLELTEDWKIIIRQRMDGLEGIRQMEGGAGEHGGTFITVASNHMDPAILMHEMMHHLSGGPDWGDGHLIGRIVEEGVTTMIVEDNRYWFLANRITDYLSHMTTQKTQAVHGLIKSWLNVADKNEQAQVSRLVVESGAQRAMENYLDSRERQPRAALR
jgi:hypothetical protein